jgi:hypothetical protein
MNDRLICVNNYMFFKLNYTEKQLELILFSIL